MPTDNYVGSASRHLRVLVEATKARRSPLQGFERIVNPSWRPYRFWGTDEGDVTHDQGTFGAYGNLLIVPTRQ